MVGAPAQKTQSVLTEAYVWPVYVRLDDGRAYTFDEADANRRRPKWFWSFGKAAAFQELKRRLGCVKALISTTFILPAVCSFQLRQFMLDGQEKHLEACRRMSDAAERQRIAARATRVSVPVAPSVARVATAPLEYRSMTPSSDADQSAIWASTTLAAASLG